MMVHVHRHKQLSTKKQERVNFYSTLIRTCLAETQKVIQVVRSFPTGP